MPDLIDQMYCSQQILIPPSLPSILKKYAKAAIRTQPRDLLLWSYYYFKAVANGLPPPVKERIEYPPIETESGLTPGFLKVLLKQVGPVSTVSKGQIIEKWEGICLDRKYAELLFKVGQFPDQVEWIKFVALAAGTIEKNLTGTMSLICELLTEEPDGGSAMVPIDTFLTLYKFLAVLDCGQRDKSSKEESEEECAPSGQNVEYSRRRYTKETSEEGWDDLIRNIGDQKSQNTVATDDLREVDSRSGLAVWPDLIPEDLKLGKEASPQISEELVTSEAGLQSEDKVQEEEGETEQNGTVTTEKENEVMSLPEVPTADEGEVKNVAEAIATRTEDGEEQEKDKETEQRHSLDGGSQSSGDAESEKSKEGIKKEVEGQGPEQDPNNEELPPVLTLLRAESDLIWAPTPQVSDVSLCSEGRSIASIGESEKEPSTGQLLKMTTSLRDVNLRLKKAEDEYSPVEWAPGDFFLIYIPGIGPPVPQEVVEEVEAFLRNCAAKQCGMVMPRNLRNFLCPPLDGLPPEVYVLPEPECLECNAESLKGSTEKLKVPCMEHIIF